MARDVTATEAAYTAHVEQLLTLADADCRRIPVRKARALGRALKRDLGDELSAAQEQLVLRASVLGTLLENCEARLLLGQQVQLSEYLEMANTQKRMLAALGLERVARDVTLGDLLRSDHLEQQRREQQP
jgi:hypothetical protein